MKLFFSHARSDRIIAEYIRSEIIARREVETDVFLASRPGDIPSGAQWWKVIQERLRASDRYLFLLTPQSVSRPWIAFELGAAWMSERPLLVVSSGSLALGDIPMPLSAFQVYSLEDPQEAEVALKQLNAAAMGLSEFCERVRRLSEEAGELALDNAGWLGLEHGGRYFAWGGPGLHSLEDRPPVPVPPDLPDALREHGMSPRFGVKRKLTHHLADGLVQVFETDRTSWRREVLGGGDAQILLAKPGSTE